VLRETFALGPHLYVVNAREDLVENVCRAIAEGFRTLGPEIVDRARRSPDPDRARSSRARRRHSHPALRIRSAST
jgi:hypothetical protein